MIYKLLTKVVLVTTFLFSSQLLAVTAADIENADPKGQTVEWERVRAVRRASNKRCQPR